mmetsp:Transcript_19612/g.41361  ORF Transcript_19612/g.41361 Transcript_19612/m.41361 type:complete len:417 (+) Transcript_19612:2246-3496(+)
MGRAAHEHLQLLRPEEPQHRPVSQKQEASLKGVKLRSNGLVQQEVDVQVHVLVPILLGDWDARASRLQLEGFHLPEGRSLVDRKIKAKDVADRPGAFPLEKLLQAPRDLRLHHFQILHSHVLAKQLLVKAEWKVDIQDDAVVDGETNHEADQHEVCFRLETLAVEPVGPGLLLVHKEVVVRLHHGFAEQLEELLLHSAGVHAFLADEGHFQGLVQVVVVLPCDFRQGVLDEAAPPDADDAGVRVVRLDAAVLRGRGAAGGSVGIAAIAALGLPRRSDRAPSVPEPENAAEHLLHPGLLHHLMHGEPRLRLKQVALRLVVQEERKVAEAEAPATRGHILPPHDVVLQHVHLLADQVVVKLLNGEEVAPLVAFFQEGEHIERAHERRGHVPALPLQRSGHVVLDGPHDPSAQDACRVL